MKSIKTAVLSLVAIVCLQVEATAAESKTVANTQFETALNTNYLLAKRKGNRKKRGFMWGLFKKKMLVTAQNTKN